MKLQITEKKLSKLYSKKYCLLTGNATTSLFLCLKSLNLPKNSKVMMPNSACPHVPLSAYLAGLEPLFVDIDKKDLSLNIKNVRKFYNKRVKAIIAIHAYGIPCQLDVISNFCRLKKIFLIEDAAIAQTLKINQKRIGNFGVGSVLSFGTGKLFDIGSGGAILTDNKILFGKINNIYKKLDNFTKTKFNRTSKLSDFHTSLYNKYFINNKKFKIYKQYKKKAILEAKNFLYKFEIRKINKIIINKSVLNKIVSSRRANTKYIYKKLNKISNNFFNIPKIMKNEAPWRANIFFKKEEHRNIILKDLLKKNIRISSWHPSLDLFFEKRKKNLNRFPISDNLGNKILNIWVNHEINRKYLNKIFDYLNYYKKKLIV